jgi:hypothetical protein
MKRGRRKGGVEKEETEKNEQGEIQIKKITTFAL